MERMRKNRLATFIIGALISGAIALSVGAWGDGKGWDSFLSVIAGGTGNRTLTDHGVMLGSGTSAVTVTDSGADGEVLTSNGSSADPDWEYLPKQNLLTNSGFALWSNGTVANYGSDLTTNGTFDSDITSWDDNSTGDGSFAFDTDHAEIDANTGTAEMGQTITTLTVGHQYRLSFTVAENCTSLLATGGTSAYGGTEHFTVTKTATGAYTKIFTAAGTSIYLEFKSSTNEIVSLDSISLYEVTPACIATDDLGPDGWGKTGTLDLYREPNGSNTVDGAYYALKVIKGADTVEVVDFPKSINTDPAWYEKFTGRTVTSGAWVVDSKASNSRLRIDDGVANTNSAYHTGGGSAEFLTVTHTVNASPSEFTIDLRFEADTSDVAYVSQPVLVFGSSIGEGNYHPRPGEIIDAEATIALTDYTADDDATADIEIDLQAQSSGKIGAGAKAVYGWIEGQNSAADKYIDILSESGGVKATRLTSQVANVEVGQMFRAPCDSEGNVYLDVEDGNWDDVTIEINAVEMRQ